MCECGLLIFLFWLFPSFSSFKFYEWMKFSYGYFQLVYLSLSICVTERNVISVSESGHVNVWVYDLSCCFFF